MSEIRVLVFRAGQSPAVETLQGDTLKAMQRIVGGYVECVSLAPGIDIWCNDSGMLDELALTFPGGHPIYGDSLIARTNAEGDTCGLTDADIALWSAG